MRVMLVCIMTCGLVGGIYAGHRFNESIVRAVNYLGLDQQVLKQTSVNGATTTIWYSGIVRAIDLPSQTVLFETPDPYGDRGTITLFLSAEGISPSSISVEDRGVFPIDRGPGKIHVPKGGSFLLWRHGSSV